MNKKQQDTEQPGLGDPVKDEITGFSGMIIGTAQYLTGSDQCLVQPKGEGNDLPDSYWFNIKRLKNTKKKKNLIGF